MITITEEMLDALREHCMRSMSAKRFRHTVAVEGMTVRLCTLFCPDLTLPMRAAALLHDITKELTSEAQEALCRQHGLQVTESDRLAPKTFHARTAAALIPSEFPQFDDPLIVNAVRWHTTGHAGMTLTEKILYFADYTDDSREYENCVILRRFFWGAEPQNRSPEKRDALLRDAMILSYDMTIRDLLAERLPVAPETVDARNEMLLEAARAKN